MAQKKKIPASQLVVLCAPHFGDHYLRGSIHWQWQLYIIYHLEVVYIQLLACTSQFGNHSFMSLTSLNTLQACQWHNPPQFLHL